MVRQIAILLFLFSCIQSIAQPSIDFTGEELQYALTSNSTRQVKIPKISPNDQLAGINNNLSLPKPNGPNLDFGISQGQDQMIVHSEIAKQHQQNLLRRKQILKEFSKPAFRYNLPVHGGSGFGRYAAAFREIEGMLVGSTPVDMKRAVWLVESAYDPTMDYEEFSSMIDEGVRIITLYMAENRLPETNMAKVMAIFKYMADTITVRVPEIEKTVTTRPMLYDYEDFGGKQDPTKVFVSKLLRSGSGQCMSLPMLFLLYAKEIGAEAFLAFAPEHTYIKFRDGRGNWQNIELTGRMFSTDDFLWSSGFITAEQVRSGIYLRPLPDKEVIAYQAANLAITYKRIFGVDDFVGTIGGMIVHYFPNNLNGNALMYGYYKTLSRFVSQQYKQHDLSENDLDKDENAQRVLVSEKGAATRITKRLGWREMPDWAYKAWLDGVNEIAAQRQHLVRKRQLEQQLK